MIQPFLPPSLLLKTSRPSGPVKPLDKLPEFVKDLPQFLCDFGSPLRAWEYKDQKAFSLSWLHIVNVELDQNTDYYDKHQFFCCNAQHAGYTSLLFLYVIILDKYTADKYTIELLFMKVAKNHIHALVYAEKPTRSLVVIICIAYWKCGKTCHSCRWGGQVTKFAHIQRQEQWPSGCLEINATNVLGY